MWVIELQASTPFGRVLAIYPQPFATEETANAAVDEAAEFWRKEENQRWKGRASHYVIAEYKKM